MKQFLLFLFLLVSLLCANSISAQSDWCSDACGATCDGGSGPPGFPACSWQLVEQCCPGNPSICASVLQWIGTVRTFSSTPVGCTEYSDTACCDGPCSSNVSAYSHETVTNPLAGCWCISGSVGQCPAACKSLGDSCSVNSECCSNLCWWSQCMACKPLLSSCSDSSECCAGFSCCSSGCRLPDGSVCSNNNECCSNYCVGTCQTAPSCRSQGETCSFSSDCCSGLICGGVCYYPTLTVQKDGSGSGYVSSNPSGIDCGGDCSQQYSNGTFVTLSAVADGGSTFAGWSGGGCSGTGQCNVTMNMGITVTATFTASMPAAVGYIRTRTPAGTIDLRLISVADALAAGRGTIKVRTAAGTTAAADLVLTTDTNASPVRVMTPNGIRSWRKRP